MVKKLNTSLLNLESYFSKWHIRVKATKCEAVFFRKSYIHNKLKNIRLAGAVIQWKDEVEYLGGLWIGGSGQILAWGLPASAVESVSQKYASCLYRLN